MKRIYLIFLALLSGFNLAQGQDKYVLSWDIGLFQSLSGTTGTWTDPSGATYTSGKRFGIRSLGHLHQGTSQPFPTVVVNNNTGTAKNITMTMTYLGADNEVGIGPRDTTWTMLGAVVSPSTLHTYTPQDSQFEIYHYYIPDGNVYDRTATFQWLFELHENGGPLLDSVILQLTTNSSWKYASPTSGSTTGVWGDYISDITLYVDPSGGHPGSQSAPAQTVQLIGSFRNYSGSEMEIDYRTDGGSGAILHTISIPYLASLEEQVITTTLDLPAGTQITPVIVDNGQTEQTLTPGAQQQSLTITVVENPSNTDNILGYYATFGEPPPGEYLYVSLSVTRNWYSGGAQTVSMDFGDGIVANASVSPSSTEPPLTETFDFEMIMPLGWDPVPPTITVTGGLFLSVLDQPSVPVLGLGNENMYDVYVYEDPVEQTSPRIQQTTTTVDPETGLANTNTYSWISPTTGTGYTWATNTTAFNPQTTIDNGSSGTANVNGGGTGSFSGDSTFNADVPDLVGVPDGTDWEAEESDKASKVIDVTQRIQTWRDAWEAVVGNDDPTALGTVQSLTITIPATSRWASFSQTINLADYQVPAFRLVILVGFGITMIPRFLASWKTIFI